ncbi:amidohydrolase [Arthrobacter sp. JCM 19049]|uniref:amidohydrolase n=1 Tax=Arthrobacter sp. JCM 19049 TaxID=1460643 RepID=UPI0006D10A28|nr:amidohydrolase [Arthrobacter sp. JCM 19049]
MSNTEEIRDQILATIEQRQQQLLSLSHGISSHPELAFEEYWASSAVAELLENAGFAVQRAAYGLPTALEAVYGQGEFTVAVVGEYDALPEIGHGCGHNIIATAGVGAALALKPVADCLGLRIKFLGTPAEEIGGGKILMLQQGAWDDVDFSLMVHGNTGVQYRCLSQGTQAYELLDVTYTGRTAHAAAAPHEGINAGSAVTLAQVAFGLLRQQLKSSVVVSSFVVSGGTATNVIPGEAKLQVEIRATQSSDWEDARQRVRACLEARRSPPAASSRWCSPSCPMSQCARTRRWPSTGIRTWSGWATRSAGNSRPPAARPTWATFPSTCRPSTDAGGQEQRRGDAHLRFRQGRGQHRR